MRPKRLSTTVRATPAKYTVQTGAVPQHARLPHVTTSSFSSGLCPEASNADLEVRLGEVVGGKSEHQQLLMTMLLCYA